MSGVSRRRALKVLGGAAAAGGLRVTGVRAADVVAPQSEAQAVTADALMPIAEVVLPSEIGAEGRRSAVGAFVRWVRNYKEGADTDHGYGSTRIRSTGPSPARNYPAQLAALDAAARATGASGFAAAPPAARRTIVEAAMRDAHVQRLPRRPTGAHVAADLMGHYFGSAAAEDVCYRAAIGRDACRGLPGSEQPPARLK